MAVPIVSSTLKVIWSLITGVNAFTFSMKCSLVVGVFVGFSITALFSPCGDEKIIRELKGATVVIVGASKGIGEQMAYSYASKGCRLLLIARSQQSLEKVAMRAKSLGASQAYYLNADVQSSKDLQNIVQMTKEKFRDRVDNLVLNHALQYPAQAWIGSAEQLDQLRQMHQVNFLSYVELTSKFLASLKERKGRITVISSIAGKYPIPYVSSYDSTKFALQGFFGGLQQELKLAASDMSITIAVLGRIDTETSRALRGNGSFVRNEDGIFLKSADPRRAAEEIVMAALKRQQEVFYPPSSRVITAFQLPIISDLAQFIFGYIFERKSGAV